MYVCMQKRNKMSLKSIRWRYFRQRQATAGIHVPRSQAPLNHIKLVNVQNYFKIKGNLASMVDHVRRQAKSNNKSKRNNKGYYFGKKSHSCLPSAPFFPIVAIPEFTNSLVTWLSLETLTPPCWLLKDYCSFCSGEPIVHLFSNSYQRHRFPRS